MKTDLAVTGAALLTSAGLTPEVCFHSVRAGLGRLAEQGLADRTGEPITGARTMTWTANLRERRLAELARRTALAAVAQALQGREPTELGRIVVLLGRAEPLRPGFQFPSSAGKLEQFLGQLALAGVVAGEIIPAGGASALVALERAAALIGSGSADTCLVGAADSQVQLRVARWLEDANRLKCSYMTDGLMPAEGAAFCVVEAGHAVRARGAPALARIVSLASAHESATIVSSAPNTAGGLTRAVRAALADAAVPAKSLGAVFSDLNGESYRAREWAFTEVRIELPGEVALLHPADCYGDIGAASSAGLIALASAGQAMRWRGARPVLVFAGSEAGVRAAAVLACAEPEPPANGVERVSGSLPRVYSLINELPELAPDSADWRDSPDPPRAYLDWTLRQDHAAALTGLFHQRQALLLDDEVGWLRLERTEQRLLAHLDAVVAAGAESIGAVAAGVLSDQEGQAFAGAFALASIDSESARRALADGAARAHPNALPGLEVALRHAAAPWLAEELGAWLAHPRSELRALALRVGGDRHELEPAHVEPFLRDGDARIVEAAARALGRLEQISGLLELEALARRLEPSLRRAALEAFAAIDSRRALELCRAQLADGPADEAAEILALFGEPTDAAELSRARERFPESAALLRALGTHGAPQLVPELLEGLSAGSDEPRGVAAESLALITGTRPAEGETREAWEQLWRSVRPALARLPRVRDGRLYDGRACRALLSHAQTPPARRPLLARELWLVFEGRRVVDPDDFVARQRESLGLAPG